MEEKIIEILENVFTESIEFDRGKAKDELLILFGVSNTEGKFCECEKPQPNYPEMIWCDNCGIKIRD